MARATSCSAPTSTGRPRSAWSAIDRARPTGHVIRTSTSRRQLRGDFEACHTEGDNSQVVATDTQKNTVYAFARRTACLARAVPAHARPPLRRRVPLGHGRAVRGGAVHLGAHRADGDHSFVRTGRETRTAVVTLDGDDNVVVAGLKDCTVLKSTGRSSTASRGTATRRCRRRPTGSSPPASPRRGATRAPTWTSTRCTTASATSCSTTFADVHSLALQQTIFEMGKAVLERYDEVAEISLSCPNKHHFLVDLEPFGLDNPGEVFFAADRPYGLIEATVVREGA